MLATVLVAERRPPHLEVFHEASGQWRDIAEWLWDADLRYMTDCGLTSKGTRDFCPRHGITEPMSLRTLHSDVSVQDLGVVLRRAEAFLADL